jgi:hypothetical protein
MERGWYRSSANSGHRSGAIHDGYWIAGALMLARGLTMRIDVCLFGLLCLPRAFGAGRVPARARATRNPNHIRPRLNGSAGTRGRNCGYQQPAESPDTSAAPRRRGDAPRCQKASAAPTLSQGYQRHGTATDRSH